jgi:hypothetical protein
LWQREDTAPHVFIFHFGHRWPSIPAGPLIRFVKFCSRRRLVNLKTAWQAFCAQPGATPRITLQQVYYYFSAADFYEMQACLKAAEVSSCKLERVRCEAILNIRQRVQPTVMSATNKFTSSGQWP